MKLKFLKTALVGVIITLCSLVNSASAGLIHIGNGSSGNNDCTFGCMSIYQQSFDSSIFLGENLDILDMTFYSSSGDFYGEYDIFMSYAAGDLTIDFENNISQPWTYFSSVNLATDIVNSELKVSGLFNYDSTIGDLIIGLYRTSSTNRGNFLHHGSDPRIQRAYKFPNGTQFAHKDYGVNVTFNTRVANVPEPSTLAIFAFGMIGLASRRFKKQS